MKIIDLHTSPPEHMMSMAVNGCHAHIMGKSSRSPSETVMWVKQCHFYIFLPPSIRGMVAIPPIKMLMAGKWCVELTAPTVATGRRRPSARFTSPRHFLPAAPLNSRRPRSNQGSGWLQWGDQWGDQWG